MVVSKPLGLWGYCLGMFGLIVSMVDVAARVQYAVAPSLPTVVSGYQLAHTASIAHTCHLNGCRIRHDLVVIPFSGYPVHDMTNGDTFTIAPTPGPAQSTAAGTADDADVAIERPDCADSPDDPDYMEDDDPPSDDSSSSAICSDPQAVHIHRLGRAAEFGHVEWRTYYTIFRDAVQIVGGRRHEYTRLHYVQAQLDGLSDTEEAIILQHAQDIAPGSLEKLHAGAFGGRVPTAPAVNRATYKVLPQLARSHVLQLARVDHYCAWVQNQCIVQIDNALWPASDVSLRDLYHGTYIRVQVPPPPQPHWNTAAAVSVAQDVGILADFPEASELATQILEGDFGARPPQPNADASHDQPRHCKPCEVEDEHDIPMLLPPGTRMPRHRPRYEGDWSWLEQLNAIYTATAEAETIEGEPLLYVQTWFVNHRDYPVCNHPRAVRFDSARIAWLEELRFAWRDVLDRTADFSVHIVHPRPPQPRFQDYACHILLEQRRPINRVAGVITQLFEGPDRDALSQTARTLPHIVRQQDIIDELLIQRFCDVRPCTFIAGTNPVNLIAQELQSGFSLRVRFGVPYSAQWPHDPNVEIDHFADVAFLQLHADLKPVPIPIRLHADDFPAAAMNGTVGAQSQAGSPSDSQQLPRLQLDCLLFGSWVLQATQTFSTLMQQWLLDLHTDGEPIRVAIQSPEAINPVKIDMTAVYDQLYRFEGRFLLPQYHLGHWNESPWLRHWWDCQSPVTNLWIYHDGSKRAQGAGSAAVAFLYQPGLGWVFGGALSLALPADVSSYGSELHAGLLALQFCLDLLKIISNWQAGPPEIQLLHDSTTVGQQITGQWNAHADENLAALVRHLTVYIEQRFACRLRNQYVKAHSGIVGNEIADSLAGDAAEGKPLSDLSPWLSDMMQSDFRAAAAWFWTFYSQQFQGWHDVSGLNLPQHAETSPTPSILPQLEHACTDILPGILDCTIGTCNVLTLCPSNKAHRTDLDLGLQGLAR